jgi:hypothetical protein
MTMQFLRALLHSKRIETVPLSRQEAARALRDGAVHHGLVLAAFGRYFTGRFDLR